MKIEITVEDKRKTTSYSFEAVVHRASQPQDLHLDPATFCEPDSEIPPAESWEIEITKPGRKFLSQYDLHVYSSRRNNLPFVLCPHIITTSEHARTVFMVWCVATVLKMSLGIDLNTIFTAQCLEKPQLFLETCAENYGIEIVR